MSYWLSPSASLDSRDPNCNRGRRPRFARAPVASTGTCARDVRARAGGLWPVARLDRRYRHAGRLRDDAPRGESAYLAELVVAPDARREGRASALLAATMARLPDRVTTLSLAVSPDNDAARSLYEDAGFHVVDVDPEYYDGDPALLLARTLRPTRRRVRRPSEYGRSSVAS
ncbi:GNAT family N-acetyltransferase [Natronoarchaeum sp. GCM10025703]|uniref:GNAT family N-acetyltransferase n=1 Tax=Natronoarchaeum sp. GCM10025703 TaxID=3252685 RepID=UPI00360E09CD